MTGDVLMAWGPFQFTVGAAAYEQFIHSFGARWEKHPIIGRRPAAQYLGPQDELVRLRGTIFPDATGAGSAATIASLVQAAGQPTAYTLISQDGTINGVYRLERAQRIGTEIGPGGAPQKLTYDFEFAAHEDGEGQIFSLWP